MSAPYAPSSPRPPSRAELREAMERDRRRAQRNTGPPPTAAQRWVFRPLSSVYVRGFFFFAAWTLAGVWGAPALTRAMDDMRQGALRAEQQFMFGHAANQIEKGK